MIDFDFEYKVEEVKVKLGLVKAERAYQALYDQRPKETPVTWMVTDIDICQ